MLQYDADGTALYGWIAWVDDATPQPGVLLFHTGAGPQDVFLRWRAVSLARMGYIALVADVFGDASGAAWTPRGKASLGVSHVAYNRTLRERRALAALMRLRRHPRVDPTRIAVMGWCFGGLAAFDLARISASARDVAVSGRASAPLGLRAIITFHGVLASCLAAPLTDGSAALSARVLVLAGEDDPFAGRADELTACADRLRAAGAAWEVKTYRHARHAFTNPGQTTEPDPDLDYDEEAAGAAWAAALDLLCETSVSTGCREHWAAS